MKQGIIFGICATVLTFIIVFSLPKPQIVGEAQIVLVQNGEEIYSSPFFEDNEEQYIWYVNSEKDGRMVLKNEEIIEYYQFDFDVSSLGEIDKLDFEQIIKISGEQTEINMIVNKDGYVAMYEANCPDKIGVKMGKIVDTSKVITCVPHKLVVKIKGIENKGAPDA